MVVGSTLFWSAQANAALWLQLIYLIISEVDIVAKQKQAHVNEITILYEECSALKKPRKTLYSEYF